MKKLFYVFRRFFPLILFLMIAIFLWLGLQQDPRKLPSPLIGKTMPQFNLPEMSDAQQQLTAQIFQGKVTLLNIWATWCYACRAEHLVLTDIAHELQTLNGPRKKIALYGLNYKDQRPAALNWLKQLGNPYQKIIFDSAGSLAMDLGVYGTPETFLIDQQGVIRYKHVGPINAEIWRKEILPEIEKLYALAN